MSCYKGKKLKIEVFGESHAKKIGVKISGIPKGTKLSEKKVQELLDRRKSFGDVFSTNRQEEDKVIFESGVKKGVVSGKIVGVIYNKEQKRNDYNEIKNTPRPSHADYAAKMKYGNKIDLSGGGKFSGRMTAPICIAGGICKQLLEKRGITINAYISEIGKVKGKSYNDENFSEEIKIQNIRFPLIDDFCKEKMLKEISNAKRKGDSVGGKIECVIKNVPLGLGDNLFDGFEGGLSYLLFSIPAVKGVEFGLGFKFANSFGSKVNDEFYYDKKKVKTYTNNNGGINGGITNGMPITFAVAIKPTPSIAIKQRTIDMEKKKNVEIQIKGRHDACIVPRAVAVVESMAAIYLYDLLLYNNI